MFTETNAIQGTSVEIVFKEGTAEGTKVEKEKSKESRHNLEIDETPTDMKVVETQIEENKEVHVGEVISEKGSGNDLVINSDKENKSDERNLEPTKVIGYY